MKSLHLTNAWHASSGGIATHYKSLLAEAEASGRQMVMVIPGDRDDLTPAASSRPQQAPCPDRPQLRAHGR
jgi:hypothetical protein